MSDAPPFPVQEDLEQRAAAVIGKIVFALSGLELNLGLCLRCAVGGRDLDRLNPLVDRLTFKSKLDALLEIVELMEETNPEFRSDFRKWHQEMDGIRARRNAFVHGRWGFNPLSSEVINVAPGMPGNAAKREVRFSLDELDAELTRIERAVHAFDDLRVRLGI